ncbi:tRNA (guanine-N1)-methyltransferase [Desulfofarcimen acetoxidans DSM 771]|jgi:tRNA (guanine37-N1)-methyltransferase|uniref:tRNA (guanine-N(1)-)-methyltransferase n=1 Tax=Desulfofarcimen acetoxidans (strain ATCC 49208 / DSM 771 / KCTC 5769 / VKM B-1644 / 5575) TaxID=485916 RepID=C8W5A2_DESAS|nr:tRNA (guanosine(37)-N1)-methyltransferase TrmD [Desulfofarcimen acetoxidans]ACV62084.1 tRNA (guanine-N1)-methyltransferase [Desulfofarcimen acetoxidans DSM 771]
MNIDILTLFPEMFASPFDSSIIKRARDKNIVQINTYNIRGFSRNKHHTVDDTPFGGGVGMVMHAEPVFEAVEKLKNSNESKSRIILMCPQGMTFTQGYAKELAQEERLIFICGHYEGIDDRVREHLVTDEISVGDFVLTGGEIPVMVLVDAVVRLIPGVLGDKASAEEDSFYNGLLEYPHYTRPRNYKGCEVPEILLSGHHENIRKWRLRQSLLRTLAGRPDLFKEKLLTAEEKKLLKEIHADLAEILNT